MKKGYWLLGLTLVLAVYIAFDKEEKSTTQSNQTESFSTTDAVESNSKPIVDAVKITSSGKSLSLPWDDIDILISGVEGEGCQNFLNEEVLKIPNAAFELIRSGRSDREVYFALEKLNMGGGFGLLGEKYLKENMRGVITEEQQLSVRLEEDLEKRFSLISSFNLGEKAYSPGWVVGAAGLGVVRSGDISSEEDVKKILSLFKKHKISVLPIDLPYYLPSRDMDDKDLESLRRKLFVSLFQDVDFSDAHLYPGLFGSIRYNLMNYQDYESAKFLHDRGFDFDHPSYVKNLADEFVESFLMNPKRRDLNERKGEEFLEWLSANKLLPSRLYHKSLLRFSREETSLAKKLSKDLEYREEGGWVSPDIEETLSISNEAAESYEAYLECDRNKTRNMAKIHNEYLKAVERFSGWYGDAIYSGSSNRDILLELADFDLALKLMKIYVEHTSQVETSQDRSSRAHYGGAIKDAFSSDDAYTSIVESYNKGLINEKALNDKRIIGYVLSRSIVKSDYKVLEAMLSVGASYEEFEDALLNVGVSGGLNVITVDSVNEFKGLDFDLFRKNSMGLSFAHLVVAFGELDVVNELFRDVDWKDVSDSGFLSMLDVALMANREDSKQVANMLIGMGHPVSAEQLEKIQLL